MGKKKKFVLNTSVSIWSSIKSGVPQGPVLEPVAIRMYNIYVSDMPHNVDSTLLQFADDAYAKMF